MKTLFMLLFGVLLALSITTACAHQVSPDEYMAQIERICGEKIPTLENDLKLSGRKNRDEQVKVLDDRAALARDIQDRVRALQRPPGDYMSVDSWLSGLDPVVGGYFGFRRELATNDNFISLALRLAATKGTVEGGLIGRAEQAGLRRCETRGWLLEFG